METIKISNRIIGEGNPTFVIAELSCNHLQNYQLAIDTVHQMHKAGADCVKLQTVNPDRITIKSDKDWFKIKGNTLWDGRTLHDLYKEAYTPWEWHKPIKDLVQSLGMCFLSSPFDLEAVNFLDELDVPAFKIASFEITDVGLIKHAASKGKPLIISTGIATPSDIQDAIEACHSVGNDQIILLKCTSSYPTPWDEVNLRNIRKLKEVFGCQVGLSDHTLGDVVPLGAVAMGITVIEKHFIMQRSLGGPDSEFSMEPEEFKLMVERVRILESALGKKDFEVTEKLLKNKKFARSLFVVKNMRKGEIFTNENVWSIRPGNGLEPKYLDSIIGKKAITDIDEGTPLTWDKIEM